MPRLSVLAVCSVAGGFAEAAFLVLVTRAGFAVSEADETVDVAFGAQVSVGRAALYALGLVLIRVLLALAAAQLSARISAASVAESRRDLSIGFLRASWQIQQNDRSGQLQELLTTFTGKGAELVGSLTMAISSAFNLLALLGLAVAIDPAGSLVVVVCVAVLGSGLRPLRNAVRRQAKRAADAGMSFATDLGEISELGMEMHVFNIQSQTERRVSRLIDENARLNERLALLRGIVPVMYSGLAYLAIVAAIAVVATTNATDITSVGAVMLVMLRSLSYGQNLQTSLSSIAASRPFVDSLHDKIDLYRSNEVKQHGTQLDTAGSLRLENVDFHYVMGQLVLEGVNAEIKHREVVGVVGPSGSGKSTLVQLLLGLRQPSNGAITANHLELSTLSRGSLARKITFVPQSSHLVAGTISENIRFYRSDISQEEIERAAKLAHLHEDISGWPEGYDRPVGERGGHLSGGQQQRLCIARALVEDPDVLILDEPTSALDAKSEHLIRQTLKELSGRMTIVVIAHRMALLSICDRIMVIQDGHLVGYDTPTNLAASNDFYREALRISGTDTSTQVNGATGTSDQS